MPICTEIPTKNFFGEFVWFKCLPLTEHETQQLFTSTVVIKA